MWLFAFTILLGAAAIAVRMYDYAERNNGYLEKKQSLMPTAISTISQL
ncbi:hypothetical protein [Nostoc sp. NMS9]|nr:hypothetical protein [Nostoc sp. NMS9]MBN3939621.1 hypothetical protein [Nostoc sp. NMS9]